ncbi:MAG: hypothetical protein C0418_00765, partial [Coriobacteriaceae bacterium]|nr:hypothetical protein [Coriobacteriaceae bacterium]
MRSGGSKALGWFGWAVLVSGLAACVALGVGAYLLAGYSWDRVVAYRSPYTAAKLPAAEAGSSGPAGRVVVVLVDGLRDDVSRQMPGLERLRDHGSDYVLTLGQPSLSYPGWTTLLSGAPQGVSGVTTNWFEGRVPVETLLDTALASRKRVVIVGSPDLKTLYGADRAAGSSFRKWEGDYLSDVLVDDAVKLAEEGDAGFVFVLLPDVDEAGHDLGGSSPEYLETARRVDADITRLVQALEDTRTAFVVVVDHGHIDSGGHGGWEPDVSRVPAVFAGPGIALSAGEGRHEDVAPTIAALAGMPTPRHAKGEAIAAVLASTGPEVLRATWDQRFAFAGAYSFIARGKAPMPP